MIEDAKVMDHGSNAAVEKAIDRVRKQASVLLHALTGKIGFEVNSLRGLLYMLVGCLHVSQ